MEDEHHSLCMEHNISKITCHTYEDLVDAISRATPQDDGSTFISIFKRIYRKFLFFFPRILLTLANVESFKRRESDPAIKEFYNSFLKFDTPPEHYSHAIGVKLLSDLQKYAERLSKSPVEPELKVIPTTCEA
jgi:hypothetical protein